MSVTDFECAIAKSQIGRYISGDNLAPEVARQLESHIENCSRCKQLLQEKKNSLEAMIGGSNQLAEQTTINITNEPVAMTRPTHTDGSAALKPDFMEVLADSARLSLREKLKDSARIKQDSVEVPTVAPAFAYKDTVQNEIAKVQLNSPKTTSKKSFLSNFSLYHDVPDEEVKPSLSVENIRSAKAVFRDNNSSMRKPAMYLAGLCCVVAAMSLVLRDPTAIFGGKAENVAKTSPHNRNVIPLKNSSRNAMLLKKNPAKVSKVLPHKPTQLSDSGTDAQTFTNEPAVTHMPKATAKPKMPSKTKLKTMLTPVLKNKLKPAHKSAPALVHRTVHRTKTQHFSTRKSTASHRHRVPTAASKTNEVKLYTNDPTPNSKSNTSGEQN